VLLSILSTVVAGTPKTAFAGASGVTIDNDIAAGILGHWEVDVLFAGDSLFGELTAESELGGLVTANVIFEWTTYVQTDAGVMPLASSSFVSGPELIGDDVVRSCGEFPGSNSNRIGWCAESSIPDGEVVMNTTYDFEDLPCEGGVDPPECTSGLGNLRLFEYLDEDVPVGDEFDCVLVVRGTALGGDLELFTLDEEEVFGISQGGSLTPAGGLVNAVFDGWAADIFSELRGEIEAGTVVVSLGGEIDLVDLPPFDHPILGESWGPADVTSVFAWTLDANTLASVTTGLGGVPTIGDIPPPDGMPVGGELIPIDATMVLVAGSQLTAAWMIPVIVSAIGIGIVIARKF